MNTSPQNEPGVAAEIEAPASERYDYTVPEAASVIGCSVQTVPRLAEALNIQFTVRRNTRFLSPGAVEAIQDEYLRRKLLRKKAATTKA